MVGEVLSSRTWSQTNSTIPQKHSLDFRFLSEKNGRVLGQQGEPSELSPWFPDVVRQGAGGDSQYGQFRGKPLRIQHKNGVPATAAADLHPSRSLEQCLIESEFRATMLAIDDHREILLSPGKWSVPKAPVLYRQSGTKHSARFLRLPNGYRAFHDPCWGQDGVQSERACFL